jgi:MFS family permease
MIIYGNIVYTIGSILVAAATTVRSFNFMIGGRVILALGDIATQVAQYKMFSSWFPPSNGFASTLGLELAMRKVCLTSFISPTGKGLELTQSDRWLCR